MKAIFELLGRCENMKIIAYFCPYQQVKLNYFIWNPIVSIIMGSTSDLPVMEKAAEISEQFQDTF